MNRFLSHGHSLIDINSVIRGEPATISNPSSTDRDQGASPALTPSLARAALLPLPEQLAAGRCWLGVLEDTSTSILLAYNRT